MYHCIVGLYYCMFDGFGIEFLFFFFFITEIMNIIYEYCTGIPIVAKKNINFKAIIIKIKTILKRYNNN